MRAALLTLVMVAGVAGSVVALAIRRRARAWAEWDQDPAIVGMPTWPYRGEVS